MGGSVPERPLGAVNAAQTPCQNFNEPKVSHSPMISRLKCGFSAVVIAASVLSTGCVLSTGSQIDPNSGRYQDFQLVDINESVVDANPIQRKDLAQHPKEESNVSYEYHIGAHDVLSIRVWNNPDLSTTQQMAANPFSAKSSTITDSNELIKQRQQTTPTGVEVQANGTFFYPFAGGVQAVGRTVTEVREDLTKKLSKFVKNPQVSLRVQSFNSQKAQILGEVTFPRPIPITSSPLRVLDAIALAQGLTADADKVEAVLVRHGQRTTLNMGRLLDGDLSENYIMRDGDVLNIDSNRYRQIVIMGEVNQPVAMPYDQRGMSLNDALVAARDISQVYSKASGVYVLRNETTSGQPTIFRLDMSNATSLLLADRFPLHARDVVYVDTAGVTRWNRVINQVIPTTNAINNFTSN